MSPEEQHQGAVDAAREWRDEQRQRVDAYIDSKLPAKGEHIEIVWPGAAHNFVMIFLRVDHRMLGAPEGWTFLHGRLVEPENWHGRQWSFMVHWVESKDDEGNDTSRWTMLPMGGRLSDVTM